MFWLASAFCQVLVFNMLYSLEEENGSRLGLLTLPVPSQGIWLGKALAGLLLILAAQLVFLPATFVFLGQSAGEEPVPALIGLLLTDVGMAASGSLLGAFPWAEQDGSPCSPSYFSPDDPAAAGGHPAWRDGFQSRSHARRPAGLDRSGRRV